MPINELLLIKLHCCDQWHYTPPTCKHGQLPREVSLGLLAPLCRCPARENIHQQISRWFVLCIDLFYLHISTCFICVFDIFFLYWCLILFYSTLLCSVLFCSVLFCSVLFCSVLFCSILLYWSILGSTTPKIMCPKEIRFKTTVDRVWSLLLKIVKWKLSSERLHMFTS